MKIVAVYSKFVTQTYYGHPVDHFTITVKVHPYATEEEIEFAKENARLRLEAMPVESFPVAGDYATLMPQYFERHPELLPLAVE
jgi:hypothetical protein